MPPFDLKNSALELKNDKEFIKAIVEHCNAYKGADSKRALVQLGLTLSLFFIVMGAMFVALPISYWIAAALILPAAGLLTKIFVLQHDCGHGSFLNSKNANDNIGRFLSLLTFVPYDAWRRAHNKHHATSGNIDQRCVGGVDTITVSEYQALSHVKKFFYRFYRSPLFLIFVGSPLHVIIEQRLPFNHDTIFHDGFKTVPTKSLWKSVMLTNLSLFVFWGALAFLLGFGALLAIYLPVLIVTSWIGGWLFYVQHQFEDTYWEKADNWDRQEAALMGSSYYALPKILQWFTGSIGLHHIHHLCSQIPNYKLQDCMDAQPLLSTINKMTIKDSLNSLPLRLWCEERRILVPIKQKS
ncbi:MAG: fatty acid desaturase [Pseudomonadota bacterium]